MVQATPLNLLVKSHLALLVCATSSGHATIPFTTSCCRSTWPRSRWLPLSLCAAALFSLVPLLWEQGEADRPQGHQDDDRCGPADRRNPQGAAHVRFVPHVAHRRDRSSARSRRCWYCLFPWCSVSINSQRLKIAGLVLGMAGAVGVVLLGASGGHTHSGLVGKTDDRGLRPGYFLLHGLVQKVDRQVRCRHHVALGLLVWRR